MPTGLMRSCATDQGDDRGNAQAKLLTSTWNEVDGRRRRTYQLTRPGRAALVEQRTAWEEFSTAVGEVLGRVPWPNLT